MNQEISIKEALFYGYLTTKKNLWFFVKLFSVSFLLLFILFAVAVFIPPELGSLGKILGQLLSFLSFILFSCMITGFIKISLQLIENSDATFIEIVSAIFAAPYAIISFYMTTLLYQLILFVGLLLFIFPGLFFAARMYFYGFCIVDKRIGPKLAFNKVFGQ